MKIPGLCAWVDPASPRYHENGAATLILLAARAKGTHRPPVEAPGREPEPPSPAHSIPLAGDLVAALARRIGIDRLSRWVESKTGQPCGCEERRQKLNRLDEKLRMFLGRGVSG